MRRESLRREPEVSVIIPTYNRAHTLERAVRSVMNQTYQDLEILIVDDGSEDSTEEIVAMLKAEDERVRYVKLPENRGGAAARNVGLKLARGRFIAFQDSDDEWLPDKLERQMRLFREDEVGVVYSGFWKVQGNRRFYIPYKEVRRRRGYIYEELLKGNFVGTPTIVARRELLLQVGGFDESLPRLQDWDLVLRLAKVTKFDLIDEPLVIAYYEKDNISLSPEALVKAYTRILKKYFDDFNKRRDILAKHYYIIGKNLCLMRNKFRQGRGFLFKAINLQPLNLEHLLVGLLSLGGYDLYYRAVESLRRVRRY